MPGSGSRIGLLLVARGIGRQPMADGPKTTRLAVATPANPALWKVPDVKRLSCSCSSALCVGLLILGCAALLPAAAGNTPADVDGSTWRVEHAEAIQREAQRQAALAKAATPAETEAALERLHRQETGVGEPAHAPADPAEVERQARRAVEQQRIDDLQAHAFAQSRRTCHRPPYWSHP